MSGPLDDTTDLRSGPPVHEALLALLGLVGEWTGVGRGVDPASGEQFRYVQQMSFAHDGRPFLFYQSRTWQLDDGDVIGAARHREAGFWRPGEGPDDVEVALSTESGLGLSFTGTCGDQHWTLASGADTGSVHARRHYGLVDDRLVYVYDSSVAGGFEPSANGELVRARP